MADRFCRFCRVPIVWAYEDGALLFCDRQQTLDGDIELDERHGTLVAHRTWKGGGLYREHVCVTAKTPKRLTPTEEHKRDVEVALLAAERLQSRREFKRGSQGHALQVLAREVRVLRTGTRPEDDALDALIAAYLPIADELPSHLLEKLEAVRACRKTYYM